MGPPQPAVQPAFLCTTPSKQAALAWLRRATQKVAQAARPSTSTAVNQLASWLSPARVLRARMEREVLNSTACAPTKPASGAVQAQQAVPEPGARASRCKRERATAMWGLNEVHAPHLSRQSRRWGSASATCRWATISQSWPAFQCHSVRHRSSPAPLHHSAKRAGVYREERNSVGQPPDALPLQGHAFSMQPAPLTDCNNRQVDAVLGAEVEPAQLQRSELWITLACKCHQHDIAGHDDRSG